MFFIIYYLMGILGTVRMLWETFFQEADFAVFLNETVWISLLFVFCHWVIRRWKGSRWILFCLPAVLVLMGRGVFALTERIGGTAALSSGFEILYRSIHITSCSSNIHGFSPSFELFLAIGSNSSGRHLPSDCQYHTDS